MALPALEALRKAYPQAKITAITRPWVKNILKFRTDLVDDCILFDDQKNYQGLPGLHQFARILRKHQFDLAFILTKHFKGAYLARIAGIPQRIGFRTWTTWPFLNHGLWRKNLPQTGRHQSMDYLDLMDSFGIDTSASVRPRLLVKPETVRTVCNQLDLSSPRPWLMVHAGAAYGTAKRWLPERYLNVCQHFHKTTGGTCFLLGVKKEADVNQIIADQMPDGLQNLCGTTKLDQTIALIGGADCFISNDSGLMHIAGALGISQLAIFGPTDEHASFPHNPKAVTIRHHVPCAPCFKRHCPIGHDCMKGVTTDQVSDALDHILNTNRDKNIRQCV